MRSKSTVTTVVWTLVLLGASIALSFTPLFDVLGFESCFALGALAALAGGLGARPRAPRGVGPAGLVARGVVRGWLMLVGPLVVISLNALRVRNCSFASGLAWFFMLPMLSMVVGVVNGVVCSLIVRRRSWLLALAVVIASVLVGVWRFYAAPPIFGYDPFVGYFPGTLYDEEVAIGSAFVWARVYHLVACAAAIALCTLFLDGESQRLRLKSARGRVRVAAISIALVAVTVGLYASGAKLGFRLDARDVQRALGARTESEHFVLHYSATGPFAKDLPLVMEDQEFRHAQLTRLFGRAPDGKIHVYLFDSALQKQALMGAGHTFIAKPWRREIYLQYDGWPHPVLAHELAHVFAGQFGDRLFGVSRHGLAFNVGMIEGVAVAAAWAGGALTPHQVVRTLHDAGLPIAVERVLSVSFLGLNASQAYNLAGSFCRWLLDRSGAQKLLAVFARGGTPEAFLDAYGVPLAELSRQWQDFIAREVTVPPDAAAVALERLERPSVFHKVCAHELALKRQEAQKAVAGNDRARAEWLLEEVCADDPDEPHNLAELMETAHAAGDADKALKVAERLLHHPKADAPLKGRAEAVLGDLAFQRGDLSTAKAAYARAAALPLDDATARLMTAKKIATDEKPPIRELLQRLLIAPKRDAAIDLLTTSDLVHAAPDRSLFHYLFARQLEARGEYARAAEELDSVLQNDDLPDERYRREALRLAGRAHVRAGDRKAARAAFERLLQDPDEAVRADARDWIERCDFR